MGQLPRIVVPFTLITLLGFALSINTVRADGDHGHPEKKMEMEMHHHSPSSKKGPELPPGTKEARVNLKGPFCSKHPEEITEGLMKLKGVLHIEAFSGRDYILIHYDGEQGNPADMAAAVDAMKGSGWRCDATLVKKRIK